MNAENLDSPSDGRATGQDLPPARAKRERPILFSAPMVRALLAGTKTQTRRAWPEQPPPGIPIGYTPETKAGRYGGRGDRLYVKETFYAYGRWILAYDAKKDRDAWTFIDMTVECGNWYFYDATSKPEPVASFRRDSGLTPMWWKRPAIFMPRGASRILLEVTEVRVQRLQDISEEDAMREGINFVGDGCARFGIDGVPSTWCDCPVTAYAALWDSINGAGNWDANPWVWAVSFKVVPSEGPRTKSEAT